MRVSVRQVGPDEARRYLSTQEHNRRLRPRHVNALKGALERGEWRENGEAIKFDAAGRLRDGQHRLNAILLAGVTVSMVVVEDLEPEAQETMDTGIHRSMADVLALRREPNANNLAAALSTLFRIRTNSIQRLSEKVRPTPQQLLRLLEDEPDIRRFIQKGRNVAERVPLTASMATAYWYVFSRINEDDADTFFGSLQNGTELRETDPVFMLRRFLERERQNARKLPRYRIAGMLVKAWNLYRTGESVQVLTFRAGGANAEAFPHIDGLPESDLAPDSVRAERRGTPGDLSRSVPKQNTREQHLKTAAETALTAGPAA